MGLVELLLIFLFLGVAVWLVVILDVALARFADGPTQVVWALIVVFVPLGFLLYLLAGRKRVADGGLGFLHRD